MLKESLARQSKQERHANKLTLKIPWQSPPSKMRAQQTIGTSSTDRSLGKVSLGVREVLFSVNITSALIEWKNRETSDGQKSYSMKFASSISFKKRASRHFWSSPRCRHESHARRFRTWRPASWQFCSWHRYAPRPLCAPRVWRPCFQPRLWHRRKANVRLLHSRLPSWPHSRERRERLARERCNTAWKCSKDELIKFWGKLLIKEDRKARQVFILLECMLYALSKLTCFENIHKENFHWSR